MNYYYGIDIGGTKTAVGIFDSSFHMLEAVTFLTKPKNDCEDLTARAYNGRLAMSAPVKAVCFCSPSTPRS